MMNEPIASTVSAPWWWDSASNVVGVLVGALIGAVISYLIARQSSKEVLNRDKLTRVEQKKTAIFMMSVELVGIMDVLGDLRRDLSEQLAKREEPEWRDAELWQLTRPSVGHTQFDVPKFNEAALAILFEDGELELMQKMILLRRRCLSVHTSFSEFCKRREALNEHIPPPVAWDGIVGRSEVTREQMLSLSRFTMPLNELISSISEHLESDWSLAMEVAEKFTIVGRKHLERPKFEVTTVDELAKRKA
jgi:phosphate/sulfate permease